MDYFKLLEQLDDVISSENSSDEEPTCQHCGGIDMIIDNYNMICQGCGVIHKRNMTSECEFKDLERCNIQTNVFFQPKVHIGNGGGSMGNTLRRLQKWSNGTSSSREMEANTCYGLIEEMIRKIIPDLKDNCCLGEKVLHKSKLYWKHLYMDKNLKKSANAIKKGKAGSTRGEPRRCVFTYCIIKSLEVYETEYNLLEILDNLDIDIEKYNKHLVLKINGDEKTFVSDKFEPYLDIINKYRPDITLDQLINKYNLNKKNKIEKRKLAKCQRININDSSIIKTISYIFIREYITKQEGIKLFDTSSLTLDKALHLII